MASVVKNSGPPDRIDIGTLQARLQNVRNDFQNNRVMKRWHITELADIMNNWMGHGHTYFDQIYVAYGDSATESTSGQNVSVLGTWDEYYAETGALGGISRTRADELMAWLINQLNFYRNHRHLERIQPDPEPIPPSNYIFTVGANRPDWQDGGIGNKTLWPYGRSGEEYSSGWLGTVINPGGTTTVNVNLFSDDSTDVYLNGNNLVYQATNYGTYQFTLNLNPNYDNYFSFRVGDPVGSERGFSITFTDNGGNLLRDCSDINQWVSD